MLAEFEQLETLNLAFNHISGGIPEVICQLKLLKALDLSSNEFEGSIPSCLCTLRSLSELDLSGNNLGGDIPSCFGSFQFLTRLSLSDIQFQGNYSSWLCNIRSLTDLSLSNDKFASNISSCLGDLNKLISLSLTGDGFNGSIPSYIFSNLSDLNTLFIDNVRLKGTLQFSVFANLSKIKYLTVSSNGGLEIDTEYPISWVPSFQLEYLSISDCAVNRRSGKRLPIFLFTQYKLKHLFLESTSVMGTSPTGLFCNSTLSSLVLRRNLFSGPLLLPCHSVSQDAIRIDLSFNDLYGLLPNNITHSFPMLYTLNLAGNQLEGSIPESLGHAPLFSLDLSDNNLSRKLPHTLTRNQTELSYLNVSYNHLDGEMLPVDANMPRLRYLIANNNNFTGSLLSRLFNSSSLSIIDAGYNSFTDNFSHNQPYFPNIVIMSSKQNQMHGYLPKQFCQMQYLRYLDLSQNNLIGKILPCLHNISYWRSTTPEKGIIWIDSVALYPRLFFVSKNVVNPYEGDPLLGMSILDLSVNMIAGIIPQEIGELKGLRSLNLSNNHIQGFIPMTMADMETIESLDLSHNSLSGSIPHEIIRLSSLSTFSVAFNNLSGMIPYGGQFSTFLKSIYEGNPELCGMPLEKACSTKKDGAKKMIEDGENKDNCKDLNDALFYSLVTVSFSLGFSGFLASVYFNMSWRRKYFKIIDEYYNMYLSNI